MRSRHLATRRAAGGRSGGCRREPVICHSRLLFVQHYRAQPLRVQVFLHRRAPYVGRVHGGMIDNTHVVVLAAGAAMVPCRDGGVRRAASLHFRAHESDATARRASSAPSPSSRQLPRRREFADWAALNDEAALVRPSMPRPSATSMPAPRALRANSRSSGRCRRGSEVYALPAPVDVEGFVPPHQRTRRLPAHRRRSRSARPRTRSSSSGHAKLRAREGLDPISARVWLAAHARRAARGPVRALSARGARCGTAPS